MTSLQVLVTLVQLSVLFQFSIGQRDLQITNVTSSNSAQLLVSWNSSSTSVSYFMLDLRVVNNATIAPITAIVIASTRSRLMQGLRAGTYYNVTLKSYGSSSAVLATVWVQSQTVSATPQITTSNGISSSEITVGWSSQVGVDHYFLMVTLGTDSINRTYRALNCSIAGLQSSSLYSLALYAVNSAGPSAASKRMTVLTLTPPPMDVTVTALSSYSATLTWSSVEKALMYGIFVYEDGPTTKLAFIRKTTSIMITLDNMVPCTKYIFGLTSYNWFYTAGGENGVLHETGRLDSPQDVNIHYSSNIATALLSWKSSVGASSYVASAKTEGGGHESLCTSTSTSCEIQDLLCAQRYVMTITALASSCSSNSSDPLILDTALCAPQNVTVIHDCLINTVSLYWNPVVDAVKYTANAFAPDGSKEECVNRDTYCFFMNLLCGTEYEMSVFAFNGKLNGSSSQGIKVRTAPCDPQNVQAIAKCQENTLGVSWSPSEGAAFYTASALGSSDVSYNCSSVNTSCQITGLQCGESLSVSVIAYDNECPSMSSEPEEVVTAPCAPKNISSLTNCATHSTLIQWDYSKGAVLYVAHAQASDGSEHTCESFEQSCSFSELPCSQTYTVFVTASNYQCMSPYSPTLEIKTVPCIPKNIGAELICDQNAIFVTWSEDTGNMTFKATAQSDSNYYNCTTQGNHCEIRNFSCGQLYSISVHADDGQCIASSNQTAPLYSAPCKPTHVSAKSLCVNGGTEVSWTRSSGAGMYTYVAAMESNDGLQLMCRSTTGTCVIGNTKCGEVYRATVTAVGNNCQTLSNEFHVDPVPCTPINLESHVGAGLVVVSWMDMTGALNYTTEITKVSGEKHECNTSNTSCSMTELRCGNQYNMAVIANGRYCSSNVSDTQSFQTAPCVPQNVTTEVDCVNNIATVSWYKSLGGENYTSVAVGTDGEHHACHSTTTSCDIVGLMCGQLYLITVSAANKNSNSQTSLPVELQTAPCVPVQESPQLNCDNNSASLSWSRTSGAISYISNVTSPGEEPLSCHTEDTGCIISELKCGQIYSVIVTAINNQCWGPTTTPSTLTTAPCQPQNVVPKMDCSISVAQLSWDEALGALSYFSVLRTPEKQYLVCNSTELGCEISGLPCGQTYDVIVTAVNDQCESTPSVPVELYTVPCVPSDVQADVSCESNVVTLTWTETPGAVNYTSVANGAQGEEYYCQTTNTSCSYTQLACGLNFDASIVAVGNTCRSDVSAAISFHTGPCVARNISVQLQCGNDYTKISWDAALGGITYIAAVSTEDGEESKCNTSEVSCVVNALKCGQTYAVTVETFGSSCSSIANYPDYIHTAPCVPQNVKAVVICGTNMTDMSWDRTLGALNYTATVRGADGGVHSCTTVETACNIEALDCGQTYYVIVTAYGEQCKTESTAVEFHTGPCVPQILDAMPACALDFLTLSWAAALGADYYFGTLTDQNGKTLTCNTTDQSCNIGGIDCGETYNATMVAYNDQCSSDNSSSFMIYTAPCVPSNLISSVTCETHSVSVSWNDTPGATIYTVTTRSQQDETSFITTDNTYEFTDMLCDEDYEVIISSKSAKCNSIGNSSLHVKTIPCPPQILEAYASCDNNSGFIHWDISHNARSYMAIADGVNSLSCNTTETTCEIPKLECGQNYTVTVWAEDGTCTGQSSTKVTFKTVPCVPQNVISTVMCLENALHASWNVSTGATAYSATAVGRQRDVIIADTSDPSCLLSPLQCGEVYNLTVLAMHDECKSSESATVKITSVPCSPMHLTATPDCGINGASASWEPSGGAMSYFALFHGPDGDEVSCVSSSNSCSVSGMHCGQVYSVTATAFDDSCFSITTNATNVTTVPCAPTNIEASIDCSALDLINVTWSASRGAESYAMVAKGNDGHTLSCNTTANTCDIKGVHCGDNYSISVTAWNTLCSSDTVTIAAVETVPCTPHSAEVKIDCLTREALVSWQENNLHLTHYTAVTSDPFGKEQSCSTFSSSCHISGLECGLEYNFQVYSSNRQCNSLKSAVYKSMTAPCEPTDITTTVKCENTDALISWTESRGAIYYITTLSGNGTSLTCNTTDTNCSYFGLQCGQTYNASVVAMDGKCASVFSIISTFETAPCQPQDLNIDLDCSSQVASMLWGESDGAQLYNILIETINGAVTYITTNNSFNSDVLSCGQTYGFTVMAIGRTCNSSRSLTLYENTAPCTPVNVTYTRDCPTTMAFVTWSASEGANDYHVTAIESGGLEIYCNSTNISCWLTGLKCGSSYYVEVVAVDQRCSSNNSSPVLLDTAPCVPNNAAVHMYCGNSSAILSWEESRGALAYLAMVKQDENFVHACDTEGTRCNVSGLTCGASYSFSVLATDMQCNSSLAAPIVSGVVPCPPDEVETSIYRGSMKPQEVEISWNGSHCGTDYMATVQGQIGNDAESSFTLNSYWTSYMDFYIPVPCSSSYNVTVTARNLAGASYPSTPIGGYTAPCPPQVKPLVVNEGKILISWEEAPYADEYQVVHMDNNNIICTTPGLSCQVPITSSSFQVTAVNPSGESTPAFFSGYDGVSTP